MRQYDEKRDVRDVGELTGGTTYFVMYSKVSDYTEEEVRPSKALSLEQTFGGKARKKTGLVAEIKIRQPVFLCPYQGCLKNFKQTGNLKTHLRSHVSAIFN